MLFNSFDFLLFFPVVTIVYFIIPKKIKWVWLLVCSYYFYMGWNPRYALLMATSTLITYLSGILIDWSNKNTHDEKKQIRQKKLWVALSFVSNLSILFLFKYFDFFMGSISKVLSVVGIEVLANVHFDVLLPVGISFYTFQALGYTMDVYRGEIHAERNPFRYALFISFFPQLVAGPIERSKNLLMQLNTPQKFDYDRVKSGLILMGWGLFQKVVIADRIGRLVDISIHNYQDYSGFQLIVVIVLFAIQILCDFSGYSNTAIGAAEVMGFKLMQNFKQPYFAHSIKEFWSRWHISLSTWFKDYLYIPLGGNRKGKLRTYFNTMVTFLVSGLWHGANWSYVIWGALHGVYQIVGDIVRPIKEKAYKKLRINTEAFSFKWGQTIITFMLVCVGWVFFRAPGLRAAMDILYRMIFHFDFHSIFNLNVFYKSGYSIYETIFILATCGVLFIVDLLSRKYDLRKELMKQNLWFQWTVYLVGIFTLVLTSIYFADGVSQQFIYFQF